MLCRTNTAVLGHITHCVVPHKHTAVLSHITHCVVLHQHTAMLSHITHHAMPHKHSSVRPHNTLCCATQTHSSVKQGIVEQFVFNSVVSPISEDGWIPLSRLAILSMPTILFIGKIHHPCSYHPSCCLP